MNEQQNVALIQKALEAFGRGDVPTILNLCSEDSEFYFPGPETIPYTGRKRGRSEIQAYFDALLSTQRNANLTVDQFVAQGNTVVAIGLYKSEVIATGKSIDTLVMLSFDIQNGKIKRHVVTADTAAVANSYTRTAAAAP